MNVSASREKKTRGQQDEQILQEREAKKRQQEQEKQQPRRKPSALSRPFQQGMTRAAKHSRQQQD